MMINDKSKLNDIFRISIKYTSLIVIPASIILAILSFIWAVKSFRKK